jgi:hypothetical protein
MANRVDKSETALDQKTFCLVPSLESWGYCCNLQQKQQNASVAGSGKTGLRTHPKGIE